MALDARGRLVRRERLPGKPLVGLAAIVPARGDFKCIAFLECERLKYLLENSNYLVGVASNGVPLLLGKHVRIVGFGQLRVIAAP